MAHPWNWKRPWASLFARRWLRDPTLARLFGSGANTFAGVGVSEDSALNIAAFFQGVGLISAHIAAVPLDHYKRGLGRVKTALTGSKLDKLFNQAPNPEMTPFTMRETMQAHLLTWGNAYAEIEWNNLDQPIGLWPITPDRVTVYRDRESQAIRYRVAGSNGDRSVESENMFHPPGLGFDGLVGYSVIARARQSLGLSSAAERYGATFFGNGGSFGGTLTTPDDLDETQEGELRARIDRLHQGPDRAHKFLILSNGLKYEKFAIPPDDAQFLETRTFQVEEIARWLNLPPHKLKHLEHATFSNIEQQNLDYYTDTLWTWYERWEDEIRRKLIPASEWNLQFAKFNINALLRGDIKSRYDAYAVGKTAGFLSINDIHDKEDMPPVAGGDVYLQPLNMIPADQFKAYTDKQLQPPPAPAAPTPPATSEADVATANTRAALAEATAAAAREELALRRQELEDVRARPVVEADTHATLQAAYHAQEQRAAGLETLATEARREAEELRVARDAAEADRAAAARAADEAQRAAETDQRAAAAAEAARVALETEIGALRDQHAQTVAEAAAEREEARRAQEAQATAHQARQGAVLLAHRALVADIMRRMLEREIARAQRAQGSPEKMRRWMATFYEQHEALCVTALRPAIRVHLAWCRSEDDPDRVTRDLIRSHVHESIRQLEGALEDAQDDLGPELHAVLHRWQTDRPEAFADAVIRRTIDAR